MSLSYCHQLSVSAYRGLIWSAFFHVHLPSSIKEAYFPYLLHDVPNLYDFFVYFLQRL